MAYVVYSVSHVILLVGGGIVAGVLGTAGGITSLVSYPALAVWLFVSP